MRQICFRKGCIQPGTSTTYDCEDPQNVVCLEKHAGADGNTNIAMNVFFLEVRKSRFLGPGNPEIWGPKNEKKIKVLKIQIHSAQNVGKVWISRKKILLAPFGAI